MTQWDRYIGHRFFMALARVLISLVFFFVAVDLLTQQQERILDYNVPWHVVALYYLTLTPTILFEYQAAALAVLVAGLVVLGRASQDQEITAALVSGVSLRRLLRAPIIIALLLAGAAFVFEDTLGVWTTQRSQQIKREYFKSSSQSHRSGVSWANLPRTDGSTGNPWTCHVLKFNRIAMTGEDVYIHAFDGPRMEEIRAARIFWDEEQAAWLLERGHHSHSDLSQHAPPSVERISQREAPFSVPPEKLFALEEPATLKSVSQLARDLRNAASLGIPVASHWVDFHTKFARPALCFVMILLAAPFAVRIRRGGMAAGFAFSVIIALVYLMIFYACIGLGHIGLLSPWLAAWLANILFLVGGGYLFLKTPT